MVTMFDIFRNYQIFLSWSLHLFTFPAVIYEGSSFATSSSTFVIILILAILMGVKQYIMVLVCISFVINDMDHLFMCLLAICMSYLANSQTLFFSCTGCSLRHMGLLQLWRAGSVSQQHMESQFPNKGSNLCPLHWKVYLLLDHQGSPTSDIFNP